MPHAPQGTTFALQDIFYVEKSVMGYFASLILAIVFSTDALAADLPLSQARSPQESWRTSLKRDGVSQTFATTPTVLARWPLTLAELEAFAGEAFQIRVHQNPNQGDFLRRGPWLYPANGCYAKAAHVSFLAKQKGIPQPGKIYAYGDLEFDSPYAKNGRRVYWRYHMAAAYVFNEQVFIVDPGMSGTALTQQEWLSLISPSPQNVRVKYCDQNSYSPLSTCVGGRGNGANLSHVRGILRDEWSNLRRLGYDPYTLLGP